jgi:predicted GNAT family acetyltransferase
VSAEPGFSVQLEFFTDAAAFLAVAGDHLAAEPVISTVVTSVAHRTIAQAADGIAPRAEDWWVVVRDGSGSIVGAGMRTAPFPPYPPFLLPMPDEAAVALARTLHERGEEVLGVNGALPASDVFAAEVARLGGGRVEVAIHTRLFELSELISPAPVPGELVAATADHVDLTIQWYAEFIDDADRQAGRTAGSTAHELPDRAAMLHRIRNQEVWFWVDPTGQPVHLTAASQPAFGVSRIGPVYTPAAQRGRGWASNAVAEVSRRLRAQGVRVCLYTDQANPVSNKIYMALGYRPVVDMVNLEIKR